MGNHAQAPAEMAWGSLLLCGSERRVNVTMIYKSVTVTNATCSRLSNHCGQHVQQFLKVYLISLGSH